MSSVDDVDKSLWKEHLFIVHDLTGACKVGARPPTRISQKSWIALEECLFLVTSCVPTAFHMCLAPQPVVDQARGILGG